MNESVVKNLTEIAKNNKDCGKFNRNFQNVKLYPFARLYKQKRLGGYHCDFIKCLLEQHGIQPAECMFTLENKQEAILVFKRKRTILISKKSIVFLTENDSTKLVNEKIQKLCYEDIKYEMQRPNRKVHTLKELLTTFEKNDSLNKIKFSNHNLYDVPRPKPKKYKQK